MTSICIGGSFVEDRNHPWDIDGYFYCDFESIRNGSLVRNLNGQDPYRSLELGLFREVARRIRGGSFEYPCGTDIILISTHIMDKGRAFSMRHLMR